MAAPEATSTGVAVGSCPEPEQEPRAQPDRAQPEGSLEDPNLQEGPAAAGADAAPDVTMADNTGVAEGLPQEACSNDIGGDEGEGEVSGAAEVMMKSCSAR